ncbi:MAG: YbhB/YbcL family Raf kinase inhibitor-like protein [Bacteroidales bacterium]|nr:YbhB/YbcL family Raf kinase inhibitor-like protein [Bacteroidales bacterium]
MALKITSNAFEQEQMIPDKYTCDGEDISPQLSFENVPEGTKSLALICDDPDAPMGTFVHWVLFNIPPDTKELPEGTPMQQELENGARHGKTNFGHVGYGGPCPPSGVHRYYFKLYALDRTVDLEPGASKQDLLGAMDTHIIEKAEMMAKYER